MTNQLRSVVDQPMQSTDTSILKALTRDPDSNEIKTLVQSAIEGLNDSESLKQAKAKFPSKVLHHLEEGAKKDTEFFMRTLQQGVKGNLSPEELEKKLLKGGSQHFQQSLLNAQSQLFQEKHLPTIRRPNPRKVKAQENARRVWKLRQRRFVKKTVKNTYEMFQKRLKLLTEILQIAEVKEVHPSTITKKALDQERKKRQQQIIEQLLAEEDAKSQNKRRRKNKKKQKRTSAIKQSQPNSKKRESVPEQPPLPKEKVIRPDPLAQYALEIAKRKSPYKEAPRVTRRWQTRDIDKIKRFADKSRTHGIVFHYTNLNQEQIIEQRAKHYLPGLDRIFSNILDRKIYTFSTDRGLGMMAQLMRNNKPPEYGVIYFGINGNTIYHRYFEQQTKDDVLNKIFTDHTYEECPDDTDDWFTPSGYSFEVLNNGLINVTFSNESHYVNIFPVRPDLFNPNRFIK